MRKVLFRNKLVLRKNHFPWSTANLLHKNEEHLALKNNFRVTKKFLITKFDYTSNNSRFFLYCHKSYEFKSQEIFDHCWKILFYNFFQFAMNIKVARLSTVNCSANIISLPLMFVSDASTSETSITFIHVLIQNSI